MLINYEPKYSEALTHLLEDNKYAMPWGDDAVETLLWLEGNSVSAAASLWRNPVHPHREYAGIYVAPDYRRKGIASQLYRGLKKRSEMQKFQAAVSSKDTVAISFLNRCGFRLARKSYTPMLDQIIAEDFDQHLQSFASLTPAQQADVFALQKANYQASHKAINALSSDISTAYWHTLISANLAAEHSFVLLDNNRIMAYILTYQYGNELEIGYVGGKDAGSTADYLPFYYAVLNHLIQRFQAVSIEADDVDPFAYALLEAYSFDKSDSWDTYIY